MTVPQIALKVDVDTFRGTRQGVPALARLLARHSVGATFLFSLGPDHTGRAIKRVFRRGFVRKVQRTSVLRHYGVRTLLSGTLLPAPDIGRRCADIMRQVRDDGFEVGIHTYDHVLWQDSVVDQDADWTRQEMERARSSFREIFEFDARVHGAAGWQMNAHALRLTAALGFDYSSDTRGTGPFMPVESGAAIGCPQLPTTLPTLDELIGTDGVDEQNAAAWLLRATSEPPPSGHVYTLHAELEGMRWADILETLVLGWKAQGYRIVSLCDYFRPLSPAILPRHEVVRDAIPGRSGTVMIQGAAVGASTPP